MGTIIYNPNSFPSPQPDTVISFRLKSLGESFEPMVNMRTQNLTGDGNVETIVDFNRFKVSFDTFISEPEWQDFQGWFAWASLGNPFAIKFENKAWAQKTLNTMATNFEIPLGSVSDIEIGDTFFIKSPNTLQFGHGTVLDKLDYFPAVPSWIITEPLSYAFPIGSEIRYSRYHPNVVLTDKSKSFISKRTLATQPEAQGAREAKFEAMEKPY